MTPAELKQRLESGEKVTILDVRESDEFAYANLGGKHIPLGDLTQRHPELDPDQEIVVLCHHGVRSAHAVAFLKNLGFSKVHNLSGGIERWSLEVDPSVPRY
jgi:rhodanese-related sulfurtransferase